MGNAQFEQIEKQIISHSLFQKLKDVIENYPGYHDHESTYDHLLKTARIAKEQIDGHFITNTEAKEKFIELVNQKLHGTDLKSIMILTALVHDVGKILLYTEGGETKTLAMLDEKGNTPMPGHPFWGGRIVVPEILKNIELSTGAKQMIADLVKVHDAYAEGYFASKKDWALEAIISDIKSGAIGYYEEALFNQYCDCFDSPGFAEDKKTVEQIFNNPTFYNKRKYILP